MKRIFRLYRGEELLGLVEHTEDDFPNHLGIFHSDEPFETVKSLFEAEATYLNAGRMDEWRKVRDEIDAPGLVLEPVGSGKEQKRPLIHIQQNRVWWR